MPASKPIRVLIADDQSLVRRGLVAILNMEDGIRVVGEAANGLQAIEMWRKLKPDVVLMDLRMPELGGLDALRKMHVEDPTVLLIVLSTFDHESTVKSHLKSLFAKLDVTSRAEATALAARRGLVHF